MHSASMSGHRRCSSDSSGTIALASSTSALISVQTSGRPVAWSRTTTNQ
jgi:hypothetical protein